MITLVSPLLSFSRTPFAARHLLGLLTGSMLSLSAFGANTFTATGSMTGARNDQTSTLLPNGKVLVAGGFNAAFLATAELYDPTTGAWSTTGSLTGARSNHSATLLPSGKVLVVGGFAGGASALTSAQLYDPTAGTWSATSALATARYAHTATLLPNGKVLVAGGYSGSAAVGTAELYDPAAGTWSTTNPLSTARAYHTATLLPSGKVLVAGGYNSTGVAQASSVLYDPTTDLWTTTGPLAAARSQHTATLLPNGKVLVVAGETSTPITSAELYNPATGTWTGTGALTGARKWHSASLLPNGKVLVVGGSNGSIAVTTSQLYDPAAGTWSGTGAAITARFSHNATLLPNGKLLIQGGYAYGPSFASAELFDSSDGTWAATGAMSAGRAYHTATLLPSGKVLAAGGYIDNTFLTSAELYDPATATWSTTGSLVIAAHSHTATLLPSGKVLIAGGLRHFDTLSSDQLYDPVAGSWSGAGASVSRYGHSATLLQNGKVLFAGGNDTTTALNSSKLYDLAVGGLASTGSLSVARSAHTATLLTNGKVLVAGGTATGNAMPSSELYDPTVGTWSTSGTMVAARRDHTATLLPNGKVLVVGGRTSSGGLDLASTELFNPITNTWSATGSLANARHSHTATLLPSGQVMVVGGSTGGPAITTTELYDPALGTWTTVGAPVTPRLSHSATLLLTGKVLIEGGYNSANTFTNAELYDAGLGFTAGARPVITNATISATSRLVLTGTTFRGISGASGGNTLDSPTNHPLVQLRSVATEQSVFLSSDPTINVSDSTFTSSPISSFPYGQALVTVFTNGIPSASTMLLPVPNEPEIAITQNAVNIADGGSKSFGNVVFGGSASLVFTIKNTGPAALSLSGTPKVAISGADAGLFTVTTQPSATVNAFNGSTTFTVRFAPTTSGSKTAALSIANNDSDENAFDITLTGTGLSNINTLSNLQLSAGALVPTFSPSTLTYNVTVPSTTSSIIITPTATDTTSTIRVNGSIVASGSPSTPISLALGNRLLYINITAQNGDLRSIQMIINRPAPPVTITTNAAALTNTSAVLQGSVNGYGASTSVTFDYGLSTSYTDTITAAESPLTTVNAQSVSALITGLVPNTTYHYRVNATNSEGTTHGSDATFTTPLVAPQVRVDAAFTASVDDTVSTVAVRSDGKLVVGGYFGSVNGTARTGMARLSSSGVLDTAFNPSLSGSVTSLALETNGNTLAVGSFTATSPAFLTSSNIGRFNATGELDADLFPQPSGLIPAAITSVWPTPLWPISRVVVSGDVSFGFGPNQFGKGGAYLDSFGLVISLLDTNTNNYSHPVGVNTTCLAAQPNGSLVLGGDWDYARLASPTTGPKGVVRTQGGLGPDFSFAPYFDGFVTNVTLQPDGKILVGGPYSYGLGGFPGDPPGTPVPLTGFARLNANGTLDATFNPLLSGGTISASLVQANGKIIIAGGFTSIGGVPRNGLARLNSDGTLDPSFDPAPNGTVNALALQADGSLIIVGNFTRVGGSVHTRIARIINDAAAQNISVPSSSVVRWLRSGAAPELTMATFEVSSDGVAWSALGQATAITGGWELNGLSLPATGFIRARGPTAGGNNNGTSGIIEQLFTLGTQEPEIAVEQPVGNNLVDNTAIIDFGGLPVGGEVTRVFTIRNTGPGDLTGISITISGTNPAAFVLTATPATTVLPGTSTTFSIKFTASAVQAFGATLQMASNDSNENPFDISLTGLGLTPTQTWLQSYFGTTTNTGNAAPTADPNNNGIPNLIEYALGGDPTGGTTGTSILPTSDVNPSTHCMEFSLTRYLDRNDLTLTVQASDSPSGPWDNLARSVNGAAFSIMTPGAIVSETGSGTTRAVTVCDIYQTTNPSHPRRFMRLEATQ